MHVEAVGSNYVLCVAFSNDFIDGLKFVRTRVTDKNVDLPESCHDRLNKVVNFLKRLQVGLDESV